MTRRLLGGLVILGAMLATLPAPALAQGAVLKVGVVNSERILRDAAPAKAAQARLENEFLGREKEINDLGNRLKEASDRLERDGPTLSETERTRRQRELLELDRDFQRKRREFQEDLNQRKNEELAAVVDRANRAIREIAEREKFDLILQESVYFSPRLDITDMVIKALSTNGK